MQPTVLVVDDIPEVVKLIGGMLRESGYHVLEATGGSAAIGMLRSECIDLLVTDLDMPGVSGPELVRRAWKFAPQLPVVFLTAYSGAKDIPCEMLSRARIVTKPSAKALRGAIAQALEHSRTCGGTSLPLRKCRVGRKATKPGLRTGLSVLLGL
ncbi:MAG TPA: response regulator [Bryobacteraceae bacterium]|nr:response regulator [Bryobacteraceae bacterium]